MLKPKVETLFPDNNINYNIYNEDFVELTDFLCEHFYAAQNLKELDMGTEFDCFKDTANTNYFELNNINEEELL